MYSQKDSFWPGRKRLKLHVTALAFTKDARILPPQLLSIIPSSSIIEICDRITGGGYVRRGNMRVWREKKGIGMIGRSNVPSRF